MRQAQPVAGQASRGHGQREHGVAGGGGGLARVFGEIDGAPVRHRALAEQDAEGDHAQRHQRADGRQRELRGRGQRFGVVGQEAARGEEGRDRERHARREQVRQGREPTRGGQASHGGAGHAAEAEEGVERDHHRPAVRALDVDGLRVHGHVHRSRQRPVDDQGRRQGQRALRERGQGQHRAEAERRPGGDARAAEADEEARDPDDGGEGARGGPEQGQAEHAVVQAQVGLHGGDPRQPVRDEQAVDEEDDGDGDARRPQHGDSGSGLVIDARRAYDEAASPAASCPRSRPRRGAVRAIARARCLCAKKKARTRRKHLTDFRSAPRCGKGISPRGRLNAIAGRLALVSALMRHGDGQARIDAP